jgi:hypothetical protein
MKLIATPVLLAFLGASLSDTPRMVVSLSKGTARKVLVRIENVNSESLALSATTYLALLKPDAPDQHMPLYWAKVQDPGVPNRSPLMLMGLKSSTVQLDPRSLSWSRDRTGLSLEQPIGRIVAPGDYELQVQIVDEKERWWRSGELLVKVSPKGDVRF